MTARNKQDDSCGADLAPQLDAILDGVTLRERADRVLARSRAELATRVSAPSGGDSGPFDELVRLLGRPELAGLAILAVLALGAAVQQEPAFIEIPPFAAVLGVPTDLPRLVSGLSEEVVRPEIDQ